VETSQDSKNNQVQQQPNVNSLGSALAAWLAFRWFVKFLSTGSSDNLEKWFAFGLACGFVLVIFLVDILLTRIGVRKPVRSGLWASLVVGPLLGLDVFSRGEQLIWSEAVGFGSALLAFGIFYLLDIGIISLLKRIRSK
jgi:hypothetical protein